MNITKKQDKSLYIKIGYAELSMTEWPLYFKKNIVVGNPESEVGVITLWTKMDTNVLPKLNPQLYAIAGQLYSMNVGLSAVVRNLAANKNIRHLIVTGSQVATRSGDAIVSFFKNGVDKEYRVVGAEGAEVEKEIPVEAINSIRQNVILHDLRHVTNFSEINPYIQTLPKLGSYGQSEVFPKTEIKPPERFPAEQSLHIIREKYIADAWIKILQTIMRFGIVKKSQYGDDQREVLNLSVVISDQDPDNFQVPSFFPFKEEDIKKYVPEITQDVPLENTAYKYGNRLRSYFGVDQIRSIITTLKEANYSRRAVACTWHVEKDHNSKDPPCINLIQALTQDGKLHITTYIRSNEMFEGWPLNAFGLRKLQKMICEETGLQMGTLTTVSNSAHLYESKWPKTMEVIKENPSRLMMQKDPRGNFVIEVEGNKIKVMHQDPEGRVLQEFEGENKKEIFQQMFTNQTVSQIDHALDLGAELQKAEIAVQKGIPYKQDNRLEL